jgi:hypothetical protein
MHVAYAKRPYEHRKLWALGVVGGPLAPSAAEAFARLGVPPDPVRISGGSVDVETVVHHVRQDLTKPVPGGRD